MAKKYTTEEWIKLVKEIHGDKYDYSKTIYVHSEKPVKIICPIHGEFEQIAVIHKRGGNCPKCNLDASKLSKEEFIKRASKIHDNFYNYSKVNYINAKTKVKIICPIHGEFEQQPDNHLNGQKCYHCSIEESKLTKEEFIEKAQLIHGDKYDYSLVKYIGSRQKVKIICPIHGEFEQTPNSHLQGVGCSRCYFDTKQYTQEEFIEKANLIHDNKYDYSKTIYNGITEKVKIICPIHGEFEQKASSHISGSGCYQCGCEKRKLSIQEFIEKSNLIHKNKYDYSLVDYKSSQDKVKIICPIHGEFEQQPNNHLHGQGCPKCSEVKIVSKYEDEIFDYLNSIGIKNIERNNRFILYPKELDFYLPDYNLAIEFNGLFWHSEKYRSKFYHQEKYLDCLNKGIKLIQIFEDEWLYQNEIVKLKIKNILGLINFKEYSENKCLIKKIDNIENKIIYGLFYSDNNFQELNSYMIFENIDSDVFKFSDFIIKKDFRFLNDDLKILNKFIEEYKSKEVIGYSDLRWVENDFYEKLGFKQTQKIIEPKDFYIYQTKRYDKIIPEIENLNYSKIYDAGYKIYKLKIN